MVICCVLYVEQPLATRVMIVYCSDTVRCRKGEVACCDEIKSFAVKHNIKQQQIAVLAGSLPFHSSSTQLTLMTSAGFCSAASLT